MWLTLKMGPWRASCLLLLGLLLVSASREDEGPLRIKSLARDDHAVENFMSRFGQVRQMTATEIGVAYDHKYVPKGQGADFGVPDAVVSGLNYKPWKDSMHCQDYGCFTPCPNPPPYFPTIYDWTSNNPDQTISTQIMDLIGKEVFQGPFTGTLFLPTDAAWSAYLARWQTPIVNTTRAEEFYSNFFIRLLQYHTLLLRVYGSQMDGFQYSTVYSNLNAFPHKVTFGQSAGCGGGNCNSGCNGCNSGCTAGCAPPQGCTTCSAQFGNGGWTMGKHGKSHYFYSPGPYKKYHYKGYYPSCTGGGCGGGCGGSGGCGSSPCSGGGCGSTSPCSGSGCQQQQKPCSGSGCVQQQPCSGSGCGGSSSSSGRGKSRKGGMSSGGCSGGGCCSGGGGCGSGCGGGGCGSPVNFLIDEQKNLVTFNTIDKFVYGGGVLHTINSVLEPSDIFPSLTAAINSSASLSDLRIALDRIENEGNFSLLPTLEEIPGTMAMPNNEAFASAGVNVNTYPVNDLLNVAAYHFCAFTRSYRLLYYPFGGKPGKNPCLTILSRAYQINYGLAWNATNPGITKVPQMWINYATGVYPDGLRVQRANIVMADITAPIHSAAVISDLLVPPSNLPANRAAAVGTRSVSSLVRKQLEDTVEVASLVSSLASSKNRNSRRRRRAEKRAAAAAAAAAGAGRVKIQDVDADDDDAPAQVVRNPADLIRNAADELLVRGPR